MGGALNYLLGAPPELPSWVILPRIFSTGSEVYKGQTAGFLGPAHDPFTLHEPKVDSLADKDLKVGSLSLPDQVDLPRLGARRELLEAIDVLGDRWTGFPEVSRVEQYRDKALSMVTTDRGKRAFNLSAEPDQLRDQYGRNEYGQISSWRVASSSPA